MVSRPMVDETLIQPEESIGGEFIRREPLPPATPVRVKVFGRRSPSRAPSIVGEPELESTPEKPRTAGVVSPQVKATQQVSSEIQKLGEQAEKRERAAALAGAGLAVFQTVSGIVQAQSRYKQLSSKARLNIQLAQFQAAEARAFGKEAALREETKGVSRGQDILLALAAQGQDVQGALAQGQQRGEELFGFMNAMQIENNAIREALGYEQQALLYESDIRQAAIERDTAILDSILSGVVEGVTPFVPERGLRYRGGRIGERT